MLQIPFCKVHLLAVGNGELPRQGALRQGGHAEGCVVAIAGRVGFARQGLGVKPCGRLGNKLDISIIRRMNGYIDGPFGRGAGDDITVGTGKDCQSADLIGDDAGAASVPVGSAPAVQAPVYLA